MIYGITYVSLIYVGLILTMILIFSTLSTEIQDDNELWQSGIVFNGFLFLNYFLIE
jgi:hypothetical protein